MSGKRHCLRAVVGTFVLALTMATPGQAGGPPGTLSLIVENDALFSGSDRNYSNGVKAAYVWPEDETPSMAKRFHAWLFDDPSRAVYWGLALGQNIYTPENISTAAALPDEHPYAGWLYLEGSVASVAADYADIVSIALGVVGPSAQGEGVQRNFHKIIDGEDPLGWDNQLSDEPGLLVSFDRIWRAARFAQPFGLEMDVTPSLGLALGNIQTSASGGLALRFGSGLGADFGPPRIRPSATGVGAFTPTNEISWYLFGGVQGRAVAQNLFLDGNSFDDSLSVEKRPLVGEAQLGAVLQVWGAQLAYTLVARTEEFETQNDAQMFGAFSLSTRF